LRASGGRTPIGRNKAIDLVGDSGAAPCLGSHAVARSRLWVGLDVGEDTTACCIVDDDGAVSLETLLPTNVVALKQILKPLRKRVSLVALETGFMSAGFAVSIFDARQVSKFLKIKQNKTDRNDARGLAEVARLGKDVVSGVHLKDVQLQHLRSALVMRQNLVRMRVAAEGAIRSLIRLNGGRLERVTSSANLRRNVTDALSRLRKSEKLDLREEIEPILALCESLRLYVEQSDKRLASTAKKNPECRRFMEIPGVGPICALSFYSTIGDPFRFKRNADVGAYLGMTPRVRQSGQSTVRQRISRMGNRMTRSHLVTAAVTHFRCGDSAIRNWGLALQEKAGRGRARVAVARKLAITMLAIWKSGRAYDPFPSGRSETLSTSQ
jgi:transposase